jgi:hypothetical protein
MMKMMRTGQTLATCPHRFPIAIPHRFLFYVKIQLKKGKKKKEKHRSEFTLQFKPLLNFFVNFNYSRQENLCFTHLKQADR